jgi:hypothetical protein
MAHHRTTGRARRRVLTSVTVAALAIMVPPVTSADAAVPRGGSGGGSTSNHGSGGGAIVNSGNGKFNRNSFDVNDPTVTRGNQVVNNQNIGGQNPTQNSLCKHRFRHCWIHQHLVTNR